MYTSYSREDDKDDDEEVMDEDDEGGDEDEEEDDDDAEEEMEKKDNFGQFNTVYEWQQPLVITLEFFHHYTVLKI